MHYWGFGMHLFWWIFWVLAIVAFFALVTPVPRRHAHLYRQSPLEILQRRYASGEITTEEYEERKVRLERDNRSGSGAGAKT